MYHVNSVTTFGKYHFKVDCIGKLLLSQAKNQLCINSKYSILLFFRLKPSFPSFKAESLLFSEEGDQTVSCGLTHRETELRVCSTVHCTAPVQSSAVQTVHCCTVHLSWLLAHCSREPAPLQYQETSRHCRTNFTSQTANTQSLLLY